jgi:fatty acid desaturase
MASEPRERIAWYRTPVPPELFRPLTVKSTAAGLAYLGLHLGLLLATGALALWLAGRGLWWGFVPAVVLHGGIYGFLGYAGLGHELVHRTVFESRALNDRLFELVSFLTWNNPHWFRRSHVVHHQSTVRAGVDYEVVLPQQSILTRWWHLVAFDGPFALRALRIAWDNARDVVKGPFGAEHFPVGSPQRASLVRWARGLLLGHGLLAAGFIASGLWPLLLLVTLAPFIGTAGHRLLAQAQHYGLSGDRHDFRANSRTVLLNPMLAALYWQMNYHIEHHMYPAVPFFRLKALRAAIAHDLPPPTVGLRGVWRLLRPAPPRA